MGRHRIGARPDFQRPVFGQAYGLLDAQLLELRSVPNAIYPSRVVRIRLLDVQHPIAFPGIIGHRLPSVSPPGTAARADHPRVGPARLQVAEAVDRLAELVRRIGRGVAVDARLVVKPTLGDQARGEVDGQGLPFVDGVRPVVTGHGGRVERDNRAQAQQPPLLERLDAEPATADVGNGRAGGTARLPGRARAAALALHGGLPCRVRGGGY